MNTSVEKQTLQTLDIASNKMPEFTADSQTVNGLVTALKSGEASVEQLRSEAYKTLTEVTNKQLEGSKGKDSDAVMKLLNDLKKATDKTRPANFQERAAGGFLARFKKATAEVKLNITAFLEQYENYKKGFDEIQGSLEKRVEGLGDDLNAQKDTVKAILEGGGNLVALKEAMEKVLEGDDLGAIATIGQGTVDSDRALLQKQVTDIEGTIALFQTSLIDEIQEARNTRDVKNDLETFAGQAMPVFRQQAAKAVRTQRTKDAVEVKGAMRDLLNDFVTQQAQDTAQTSLDVARENQKVLLDPEVFEQHRIAFSKQLAERIEIQEQGAAQQRAASASYKQSLDGIKQVLEGKATVGEDGKLIPIDGKVAQLANARKNADKNVDSEQSQTLR